MYQICDAIEKTYIHVLQTTPAPEGTVYNHSLASIRSIWSNLAFCSVHVCLWMYSTSSTLTTERVSFSRKCSGKPKIVVVITVLLYLILETATYIWSSTCCVCRLTGDGWPSLPPGHFWVWRVHADLYRTISKSFLMEMALSLHGNPWYSLWSWYHSLRKIIGSTTAIPFFQWKLRWTIEMCNLRWTYNAPWGVVVRLVGS